jgi:hypothetical protein
MSKKRFWRREFISVEQSMRINTKIDTVRASKRFSEDRYSNK